MKHIINKTIWMGLLAIVTMVSVPTVVTAHGERSQEPFLRMRTVQWYDVTWSKDSVAVNEEVVVKGKFRIAPDWPTSAALPDVAFLNISTPGPVFVRKKTLVNGVSAVNSMKFEQGEDYEWEVHLKGRHPGKWHIHSMLNVKDAGPIVGPGKYIEVTGSHADFKNEVVTLTGETINLENYGIAQAVTWHIIWAVIAAAWLLFWLLRPMWFSRFPVAMGDGQDPDSLITTKDKVVSAGFLIVAIGLTFFGYMKAESDYPVTLPLQAAMANVDPLPKSDEQVKVKTETATYRVPGRAMKATITITNNTEQSIRLGEFNTATVRFLNPNVGIMDETAKGYPDYLLAEEGLIIENDRSIAPGQTVTLDFTAQDAAWETERIASLIYDPDSHFGGLLFFYGEDGTRYISNIHGSLIPKFI